MSLDLSKFYRYNVTDTCSVWNILSSRILYLTAKNAGVSFCCTRFVEYECLFKTRKVEKDYDKELRSRLREAQTGADFVTCHLDIEDLQTIDLLKTRKRLGKGELSSIALAMKLDHALLTDDQKARRLACQSIVRDRVQTTPHLVGWLFFEAKLLDGDKDNIISEHKKLGGILSDFFEEVYQDAFRCRLMSKEYH